MEKECLRCRGCLIPSKYGPDNSRLFVSSPCCYLPALWSLSLFLACTSNFPLVWNAKMYLIVNTLCFLLAQRIFSLPVPLYTTKYAAQTYISFSVQWSSCQTLICILPFIPKGKCGPLLSLYKMFFCCGLSLQCSSSLLSFCLFVLKLDLCCFLPL